MNLRFNPITWSLLLLSFSWSLTDEDWKRILSDLAALCPNVDFCGKTETTAEQEWVQEDICCRGCSCHSNCSKSRDCCDGTGNDDVHTKCLVPSTNQDKKFNRYHFVVEPPIGGCKQSQSLGLDRNVTCSMDEVVAPWGNFLPVYSRSLDRNFKNEPCARCHGAEDIEEWTSILYIDHAPLFVGTISDFIEANDMDDCYVVFKPPNDQSSTFEKYCFKETDSCPKVASDSFYVTSNVKMDRDSIINACEEGPNAKYLGAHGRAFKNVFCAICNGYARAFNDRMRCENTIESGKELSPPIRVLLDSAYMRSTTMKQKSAVQKKEKDICYRPGHSKNETICESLYCPSMQTLLPNGKCGFVTKIMLIDNLVLCLNLSTDNRPDNDLLNKISDTQIRTIFEENSPWSKRWFVTFVGLLISERPEWLEFMVCLELNTKQINMQSLIEDVESSLSKKWEINLYPGVALTQTFMKHGRTDFSYVGRNVTPEWASYPTDFSTDLDQPIWKSLYDMVSRVRSGLHLNQMFLCEQIQLQPDEYEHASPGAILNLPIQERQLYPDEFTSLLDFDGSVRVRVCLKDSGYVKVINRAGSCSRVVFNIFLVLVCYIFAVKFIDIA